MNLEQIIQILENVRIKVRRDTLTEWQNVNPILQDGEMGLVTGEKGGKDVGLFKFGDGKTRWEDLDYGNEGGAKLFTSAPNADDVDFSVGAMAVVIAGVGKNKIFILTDISKKDIGGVMTDQANWEEIITKSQLEGMLSELGAGDMLRLEFVPTSADPDEIENNQGFRKGVVKLAALAEKLSSNRNFAVEGDVEGEASSDLEDGVIIQTTLAEILTDTIDGADLVGEEGIYKITVDSKGRVTKLEVIEAKDLPDIPFDKVEDLGTAAKEDVHNPSTGEGKVVVVNDDGEIDEGLLPSISIVDVREFDSEDDWLQWANDSDNPAEAGDVAIVNYDADPDDDDNEDGYTLVFIAKGRNLDLTDKNNWARINIPAGAVIEVNGKQGAVIKLNTDNVPEGTVNLYFTEARAKEVAKSVLEADDKILRSTDILVLDGGNASTGEPIED